VHDSSVRFYARWKPEEAESLYDLASDLQALAGLFTAAGEHDKREDLHSVYLDILSAHRIDKDKQPTVHRLSKQSPLQILLDIPEAWQMAGGLPVFVILLEAAAGKAMDLIKQYWEINKLRLEVQALEIAQSEKEASAAREKLNLAAGTFRYADISHRLSRIEFAAFVQWDEFPDLASCEEPSI